MCTWVDEGEKMWLQNWFYARIIENPINSIVSELDMGIFNIGYIYAFICGTDLGSFVYFQRHESDV